MKDPEQLLSAEVQKALVDSRCGKMRKMTGMGGGSVEFRTVSG